MTFYEVAQTLPNGFHDAEMSHYEMDYFNRRLAFDLMVWIGDMDNEFAKELYRPARVTLEQVAFLIIEPPDIRYDWLANGAVVIDAGEGNPKGNNSIPDPPPGTSANWVYIQTTNSFLHMAAGDALLEWTGPEENRGKV